MSRLRACRWCERESGQSAAAKGLEVGKAFRVAVGGIGNIACGVAYDFLVPPRVFAVRFVWVRIFGIVGTGSLGAGRV